MTEDRDIREEPKLCSKCGKPLLNSETQKLGVCADCLKLQQTALPAPNEDEMYHLNINVRELFTKIPIHETPENQQTWHHQEEMSKEYMDLRGELTILALYIARACNEGPEVNENVNKRIILARTVLGMIIDNLAITGYDAYGMIIEMQQSLFMRVDGKKQIMAILTQIEQAKAIAAQKQSQGYTS